MKSETKKNTGLVKQLWHFALEHYRFILLLTAIIYGISALVGLAPTSPSSLNIALFCTLIAYAVLAACTLVDIKLTLSQIKHALIIIHTVSAVYIVWGVGFNSPITLLWAILLALSHEYFRWQGFVASLSALLLTWLYNAGASGLDAGPAIMGLMIIMTTASLAIAATSKRNDQYVEQSVLESSKANEMLQRDQLLTLINNLNISVVTTNASGAIRMYNAAFLTLLDTNTSLSGKKLDEVLLLTDEKDKRIALKSLLEGGQRAFDRDDLSIKLSDGEEVRLQVNGSSIRGTYDNHATKVGGYIFIIRDITRTKTLEEERDEFISVVSHELRTPITIAEGTLSNIQFVLDNGGKPEQLRPVLNEAHEQIMYLASMINDLGTLSRAERNVGDDPEEINVSELTSKLFNKYLPVAERKNLSLNLDAGARLGSIKTSRLYLEEILQNFITNAIKYTDKGGVTLGVKRTKNEITFTVTDTGIGISRADTKRIFEKFYRSEDFRTRETSGTGLGLYVTRKLAHKLNAKIDVKSRLNHGSTFSIHIPIETK